MSEDRSRANRARVISEARLSTVLDTAVDGILVINHDAEILVYNRACEKLFGYAPEEAIGQNISLIMPRNYAQAHERYVNNYMETGERKIIGIGREVRARHRDGTEFPVELSVGDASTADGPQFIGIIRDLRPRKEQERRLSEMQADLVHMARVSAMDEMGGALAHELNQPLTTIMLYLQAATRSLTRAGEGARFEPGAFRQVLDKAVHEAERAGNIISRMRQFVEKREPTRKAVDVNTVVEEAVELTLVGLRSPGRMTRDYGADLPPIVVDPVQIQQVVVNLVRNAYEATRGQADQAVCVTTLQDGEWVTIMIADNGPGIAPTRLPTLFQAFSSTKRTGMGVGLSISRTIVQNHSGDLLVDPGGQGRGARFSVRLPVAPPEGPAGGPEDDK